MKYCVKSEETLRTKARSLLNSFSVPYPRTIQYLATWVKVLFAQRNIKWAWRVLIHTRHTNPSKLLSILFKVKKLKLVQTWISFSSRLSDSSVFDLSAYLSNVEFALDVIVSVFMVGLLLPYMCREPPPLDTIVVCCTSLFLPRYLYTRYAYNKHAEVQDRSGVW